MGLINIVSKEPAIQTGRESFRKAKATLHDFFRRCIDGLAKADGTRPIAGKLATLRWMAFILPLLFGSVYLYLVTGILHRLSQSASGFLILIAILAAAIALFTGAIFGIVGQFQKALFQRNREIEALLALVRQVATSLDMDEVLSRAVRKVTEVTTAEAAEVWLADGGREHVVMRQRYGASAAVFTERTTFKLGEGIPGLAAATGNPVIIHDLPHDERFLRESVKAEGSHTYCAFPLRSQQGVVGVLGLAARSPDALAQPAEIRLVEAMANQLAVAVENAWLHERVQQLAVLTERERIARELHDGMAQVLTYVNAKALTVERLLAKGDKEEASKLLLELSDTARRLYTEVREAILSLRTPVSPGSDFLSVLRQYAGEYESLSGLTVQFQAEVSAEDMAPFTPVREIQVLRIVQEALTNVRQHAQATQAWVILRSQPAGLEVVVKDNGRGFDIKGLGRGDWPRFGLQTMGERAKSIGGAFRVDSKPGAGTTVTLEVPRGTVNR